MTIKGYSSSKKFLESGQPFITLQPIHSERHAIDVVNHNAVTLVAADAAEALSTKRVIVATTHVAKKGQVLLMTSGSASGEYCSIIEVDTNSITLGQELSVAPAATDTFEIYRYVLNSVAASGSITVVSGSRSIVDLHRHDYVVNVTTAAYTELIASTAGAVSQLFIFDSSGETMILAVGGIGSEVDTLYIFPGGFSGPVDIAISAGSRISVKALSANATAGEITLNLLG